MPIEIKIREVAQSRGLTNAYKLRIAAKIAPSTATRCYQNQVKVITFDTLEKLCDALHCKPSDLFKPKKQ